MYSLVKGYVMVCTCLVVTTMPNICIKHESNFTGNINGLDQSMCRLNSFKRGKIGWQFKNRGNVVFTSVTLLDYSP